MRRADARSCTRAEGRETRHSFSFGAHYDPANTAFGLLAALNDEHLPPGTGYAAHPHRETEIVSVVLAGSLRHASEVGEGLLGPGDVQRLTAGTGVVHSETAADPALTTRFVQAWMRPAAAGLAPAYELVRGALGHVGDALVPLELGDGSAARLHLGRVAAGLTVRLPVADLLLVLVAEGGARLHEPDGTHALAEGDEVRADAHGPLALEATRDCVVLAWAMPPPDPRD